MSAMVGGTRDSWQWMEQTVPGTAGYDFPAA